MGLWTERRHRGGVQVRALVVYSSMGRMFPLAKSLGDGLAKVGYDVQHLEAGESRTSVVPMAQYDLVCVGSPVIGAFGGKIADDIAILLAQATRLEGKACVAFVRPRMFGTARSLQELMKALERQGAWVQDFASIANGREAVAFGERLRNVTR